MGNEIILYTESPDHSVQKVQVRRRHPLSGIKRPIAEMYQRTSDNLDSYQPTHDNLA